MKVRAIYKLLNDISSVTYGFVGYDGDDDDHNTKFYSFFDRKSLMLPRYYAPENIFQSGIRNLLFFRNNNIVNNDNTSGTDISQLVR